MLTPEFRDHLTQSLHKASPEAKDFFLDIMTESILASKIMSEEEKIEVRIMKATRELKNLLDKCLESFANPIPSTEEGKKVIHEIYPARQAYLEWLQLTKVGLESHLATNTPPKISEEFLEQQKKILLERRERSCHEKHDTAGAGGED